MQLAGNAWNDWPCYLASTGEMIVIQGEISCCIDAHRKRGGGLVVRGLPDSTHSFVQEEDLPPLLARSPKTVDSLLQTVQSGLVLFTPVPTCTLGSLTCAVLKRFSSIKCDPSMESVVRMCLDATALQLLNTQQDAAALADHQSCDKTSQEMYITASFFNHSCEPNCVKKRVHGQHSGLASVTALRDIKAGEALTISYIDLELPRSARQLELKTSFFFDCKCIRCERELTEGSQKCSYIASQSQRKSQAPKRRGLKARVSR
ncbi:hypothetical protein WJX82_006660 [Trebouxia sp. C0006]